MSEDTPVVFHVLLIVFEHEANYKEQVLQDGQLVASHGGELSEELFQSAIPGEEGGGEGGEEGGEKMQKRSKE